MSNSLSVVLEPHPGPRRCSYLYILSTDEASGPHRRGRASDPADPGFAFFAARGCWISFWPRADRFFAGGAAGFATEAAFFAFFFLGWAAARAGASPSAVDAGRFFSCGAAREAAGRASLAASPFPHTTSKRNRLPQISKTLPLSISHPWPVGNGVFQTKVVPT